MACGDSPTAVTEQGAFTPSFDAGPAFTQTTTEFIPVTIPLDIPCALDGAGESVILEGTLRNVTHMTIKGDHLTYKYHSQPQHVVGYGLTSGDKYQGHGVALTSEIVNGVEWPYTSSFIGRFIYIGQGPGNNRRFFVDYHLTINANGVTTTLVDNFRADCK